MDNASYAEREREIKARLEWTGAAMSAAYTGALNGANPKPLRCVFLDAIGACQRERRRLNTAWNVLVCQRHAYGLMR